MQDSSMQRQWQSSHIGGANAAYVDELYESYLTDPNSVPEDWRVYFEKVPSVDAAVESDVPKPRIAPVCKSLAPVLSALSTSGARCVCCT